MPLLGPARRGAVPPHRYALRFLARTTNLEKLDSGCGTDYLAEITYPHLIEISDDNVAHVCNYLKGRSARDRYRLTR